MVAISPLYDWFDRSAAFAETPTNKREVRQRIMDINGALTDFPQAISDAAYEWLDTEIDRLGERMELLFSGDKENVEATETEQQLYEQIRPWMEAVMNAGWQADATTEAAMMSTFYHIRRFLYVVAAVRNFMIPLSQDE